MVLLVFYSCKCRWVKLFEFLLRKKNEIIIKKLLHYSIKNLSGCESNPTNKIMWIPDPTPTSASEVLPIPI